MKVQVAGHDIEVTPGQINQASLKWFASNVLDGELVDGRTFRAWVDAVQWSNWIGGSRE